MSHALIDLVLLQQGLEARDVAERGPSTDDRDGRGQLRHLESSKGNRCDQSPSLARFRASATSESPEPFAFISRNVR